MNIASVVDTKEWMQHVTPSLHDHLKAHQFKFCRDQSGCCKMYYKEWSSDTLWLPQSGISLLPPGTHMQPFLDMLPLVIFSCTDGFCAAQPPKCVVPQYDAEYIKKLMTTVEKAGTYLDKANASVWWKSWIQQAQENTTPSDPKCVQGTYCIIIMHIHTTATSLHIGDWILSTLKTAFPKSDHQAPHVATERDHSDDVSGMELESPHKSITVAQDFPVTIEGVGDLRTSWIGQRGVEEIKRTKRKEEDLTAAQTKATEMKVLATECLRAFQEAGLESSDIPQVKKAISMCCLYAPSHTGGISKPRATSSIHTLWNEKPGTSHEEMEQTVAPQALATSVLGKKLVATVTQENRQPPDVCKTIYNVCLLYILHCYFPAPMSACQTIAAFCRKFSCTHVCVSDYCSIL